ncbi:MAG: NAD+ synthase [Caldisericaceae bacterium]
MAALDLNYELVERFITLFIREESLSNKLKKSVVGVSGGIDSALVAALAVKALGKKNVFGFILPYKLSSNESTEDAVMMCKNLDISYEIIDISEIADSYFKHNPDIEKIRLGNYLSRTRMSILFDKAREHDAIVLGTSNKSEIMLGYSTWYGDMAAGIYPIGDLYKTQVFALSKYIGIPDKIVRKEPTADLWPGQRDEDELGAPYKTLDEILYCFIDERRKEEEIVSFGFDKEIVHNTIRRVYGTQFKRTLPPVAKFSARTLGLDFLYPHDINR